METKEFSNIIIRYDSDNVFNCHKRTNKQNQDI